MKKLRVLLVSFISVLSVSNSSFASVPLGSPYTPEGKNCGALKINRSGKKVNILLTRKNSPTTCKTALYIMNELFNNKSIMDNAFKKGFLGASGKGVIPVHDYQCNLFGYNIINEDKSEAEKVGDTGCFKTNINQPEFLSDPLHRWVK